MIVSRARRPDVFGFRGRPLLTTPTGLDDLNGGEKSTESTNLKILQGTCTEGRGYRGRIRLLSNTLYQSINRAAVRALLRFMDGGF